MADVFLGFPLSQNHLGKSNTRKGISAMIKCHLRQSQKRNRCHERMGHHISEVPRKAPYAKHKGREKAENGEQTVKGSLVTPSSHKEEYRLTMEQTAPADVHTLQSLVRVASFPQ